MHSWDRGRRVSPLPQPGQRGKYSHGIPIFKTRKNTCQGRAIIETRSPPLTDLWRVDRCVATSKQRYSGKKRSRRGTGPSRKRAAIFLKRRPCASVIDPSSDLTSQIQARPHVTHLFCSWPIIKAVSIADSSFPMRINVF